MPESVQRIKTSQFIKIGITPMYYGFCVSKNVLFEWWVQQHSLSIIWGEGEEGDLSAGFELGRMESENFWETRRIIYYACG